jgi:hypothetical protein
MQISGQVSGSNAEIGGNLTFRDARVRNLARLSLSLKSASVGGDVLGARAELHGALDMTAARVQGSVRLVGLKASAEAESAAVFNDADVRGDLVLRDATLDGDLRGIDMDVKSFNVVGAEITGVQSVGVCIDRANLRAGLFAGNSRIIGSFRMQGVNVASEIGLRGAQIHQSADAALVLEGAQCQSFNADNARFHGIATFIGADVTDDLSLAQVVVRSPGPYSLYLDRSRVGNAVQAQGIDCDQGVRAADAQISSRLNLRAARVGGTEWGLLLEEAHIGTLVLPATCASINVATASIGNLITSDEPSTNAMRELVAEGLTLRDVHGPFRTDVGRMAKWLDKAHTFAPQPWWEFAKVYERNGLPNLGRRLRVAAEWRLLRHHPGPPRLGRAAYGLLAGWGYLPFLAAVWLVALLATCSMVFAQQREDFLPVNVADAVAVVDQTHLSRGNSIETDAGRIPTGAADCSDLNGYPCFSSIQSALVTVSPPGIFVGQTWSLDAVRSPTLWVFAGLARLTGWILSILFVAGIVNLLRKAT